MMEMMTITEKLRDCRYSIQQHPLALEVINKLISIQLLVCSNNYNYCCCYFLCVAVVAVVVAVDVDVAVVVAVVVVVAVGQKRMTV